MNVTIQQTLDLEPKIKRPSVAELSMGSKAVIMSKYLDESDPQDWALGYSGGKDSTALLDLVVKSITSVPPEKRTRKVHVRAANTAQENPLVHEHMVEQVRLVRKYIMRHHLPMTIEIVQRPLEDSYFYLVLGKGYPLPSQNGSGRWCTDRLKIQPQKKAMETVEPSFILTGVRKSESAQRAKSIEKWAVDEFVGEHANMKNSRTFNPLIHWTVEDIWKYLAMEGLSWGSTLSVRTIYKDATGECGFTNPMGVEKKSVEVCGARHGCWNCPVITKDRSTEKMSEKHTWMEPLTEWRETQLRVHGRFGSKKLNDTIGAEVLKVTKSGYRRNLSKKIKKPGKRMKDGQGCLTLPARQYLFDRLIETEKMMNRLRAMQGLSPLRLITDEEIQKIKEQWEKDLQDDPTCCDNQLGLKIESVLHYLES